MFQFTGLPPYDYGFIIRYTESVCVGCPIRRSPDQRVFAPPRSFSQLVTSFIGSQCQGIRPAPFMLDRITVTLPVIALTGSLMNCFFSASPGNGDTADRNFRFRPESSHFCDSSDVFLILFLLRLDVSTFHASFLLLLSLLYHQDAYEWHYLKTDNLSPEIIIEKTIGQLWFRRLP